ncbi:MAG TPA: 2-dehydropantoate 2-reductase [Clostridiales bacterium]|nr:2-dehydropantoate 2-reductase [Clostridiales bacterium]
MRTAIVGVGSMGLVLGAYLSKAKEQVDLIDINEEHIKALKENGATITGMIKMNVPVNAITYDEITEKYDLIFLMTKQMDNKRIVENLLQYMNDDAVICTMQNGMPEPSIAQVIGEDRVVGCTIAWGATYIGPGVSELTSEPDALTYDIGTMTGKPNPKLNEIKRLLSIMGETLIVDNFAGARWAKLIINASFSGMSAVMGCTFGEAAADKRSRLCILRIIKECIDVTKALGIKIEPIQGQDVVKLIDYKDKITEMKSLFIIPIVIKKHNALKASMLQDLEHGRKTEIDAMNGAVSYYGKQAGVPTPYNDLVVKIVHEIEDGVRTYSYDNLDLFKDLK